MHLPKSTMAPRVQSRPRPGNPRLRASSACAAWPVGANEQRGLQDRALWGSKPLTGDFSATRNFPVYDAWDGLICVRPALIRVGLPSKLSVFRPNYGKFERKTSGNWVPGFFGGLGLLTPHFLFSGIHLAGINPGVDGMTPTGGE